MLRRLFTLLSALSLLLCAAVVALWVDSKAVGTRRRETGTAGDRIVLTNDPDGMAVVVGERVPWHVQSLTRINEVDWRPWLYYRSTSDPSSRQYTITIRHGLAFAITAVAPALWAACWLTRPSARRLARGSPPRLCPRCGYDVRATPGRCPEMFSRL